ncbi:MAG TPA: zinc-binding dehydrogenase [Abditibacteriaceae bacterium]|jgi:threonine dehydrogenase-like Zn-dependent dehydrogenase
MKTLIVTAPDKFEVIEAPIPQPGAGEVLLRVEAVTTCPQWDLHLRHNEPMFLGHQFHYPYTPGQPGHEATGIIEVLGEGVSEFQIGERASAWRDTGHDTPGCYAQFVVKKSADLIRVPSHLPFAATAPLELAMCVGAQFLQLRKLNLIAGRKSAVMGLGPAGLIALQMMKAEGAQEVIGFDLSPARRELALQLGADTAFNPREFGEQFPQSGDAKIGCAIDCVGAKATVEWLMDHTRETVALFGVQREDYTFAPRHYSLKLIGYPGHSRTAAEYAVRLMESGQLNLAPLVTHQMPLEDYGHGVDLLEKQEAIKVCFLPWQ